MQEGRKDGKKRGGGRTAGGRRVEVGGRQAEKHFACAHSLALDESTEGERAATMTFHDYSINRL